MSSLPLPKWVKKMPINQGLSRIIQIVLRFVLLSGVAAFVIASASPTQIASGSQRSLESAYAMFLQEAPARRGPPGFLFTVRASGFRSFEVVESIKLGGKELLGNRAIYTDADGRFTAEDLQVPGLDPGRYALIVTVASGDRETNVTSIFEVTAQKRVASGEPPASGLAPLLDTENLVRVFLFRNSTKDWLFYDPRPAFAAANTLVELFEREIYWIKVSRDQDATLNGKPRNLTCANPGTPSENCWNLVVW